MSDTRKSGGMDFAAEAAAAVVLWMVGSMKLPAWFRIAPVGLAEGGRRAPVIGAAHIRREVVEDQAANA